MANVSPKRWTETFQMRVGPEFHEAVARIAAARGLSGGSEVVRELVAAEDAKLKAKPKRR